MSVLVIPNEAEDSGDAPARQEGRGESEVEAVEPPATGPLSPAQAEDAGADELSGQGASSLESGTISLVMAVLIWPGSTSWITTLLPLSSALTPSVKADMKCLVAEYSAMYGIT